MGFENHEFESEQGPSWARPNWPLADTDDLTAAMDPTQMQVAVKAAAKAAGKPIADADVASAAADSIRAMMLVRTYRVRGHLAADLDPLGLARQKLPADISPEYHGFTAADIMSRDLVTVGPEAGFDTVAEVFRTRGFHSLPVVADGALLGVIFQIDLIRALWVVLPGAVLETVAHGIELGVLTHALDMRMAEALHRLAPNRR